MKFFITTPIYYVNDVPHIGSAYTTLVADVLARAHRQWGHEVRFITGTDEHGLKIAQKAQEAGLEPQAFADKVAAEFEAVWQRLGLSHNIFVRTTDKNHEQLVAEVMQELYDKGLVYPGQYEGWYCVGCEEYKDVVVTSEGEVPVCDIHNKPLEFIREQIYYFALSRYQDQLIKAIESDTFKVSPLSRKNEVLSFLKGEPLRDIPVTRSKVSWGVPLPFDSSQTVYVWFDALLNYLSFSAENANLAAVRANQTWWPASLQLLGKDILRFHAVIWPALLMALDLPLPNEVFAHGFFTLNGQKMSKSLGNVVLPDQLIQRYGRDAARYLIVSAVHLGADGDISIEKMDAVYTSQLANGLGNLLQRTISLINRYGVKPQVNTPSIAAIQEAYLRNDLTEALTRSFLLVDDANRYLATMEPWKMENDAQRETVLVKAYEELLKVAQAIRPVMPDIADKVEQQLNSLEPQPLFPRLEV